MVGSTDQVRVTFFVVTGLSVTILFVTVVAYKKIHQQNSDRNSICRDLLQSQPLLLLVVTNRKLVPVPETHQHLQSGTIPPGSWGIQVGDNYFLSRWVEIFWIDAATQFSIIELFSV